MEEPLHEWLRGDEMNVLFLALVFTLLVVIIKPYEGINHNQINVYEFKKEYAEKVIEVIEPETTEDMDWSEYIEKKYGDKYKAEE